MDKKIQDAINRTPTTVWDNEPEVKNAKIYRTELGIDDHGILNLWLFLDYRGGGQGFGGYALDEPIKDTNGKFLRRQGTDFGMEFINRILKTLEIGTWEKLPGSYCRVVANRGKVHAIGHYIKNQWFSPEDLAKEMNLEGA